jgi:hypothetical protein
MENKKLNGYGHKRNDDVVNIPFLCRFWTNLQRSLPEIRFLGLNVSLTIATAIFLSCVRFIIENIMVHTFGWPNNLFETKNAASSLTAIVHSINLVPTLFVLLFRTVKPYYNPSARMADEQAGLWWNETVTAMLQFCTGYMVYDGLLNIIWLRWTMQEGGISNEDLMFLGHHVATILYMSSTRWVQAGHQSAMICMFLGELSNPLHNSYFFAVIAQKLDCCNGPFSQQAFATIEFLFGCVYVILRGFIAPIAFAHACYSLATTGLFKVKEVPAWLIFVWIALIWTVELGSIPWIIESWGFVLKPLPTEVALALTSIFGGEVPGATKTDEL